jgi:hypothetical protein
MREHHPINRCFVSQCTAENCVSRRWKLGWTSYLSGALAHDSVQGDAR